ncbi:MAG: PstS family phosphate ABC transporter substrate-binding protein [Cyanosarcina radialis HA8281-LM2]|jgi:phosphate transport system substrate-binding protein|nr:PstS family phosphate ABC transporter substrate-binding protein [Cyanosarcina radialis HA8281-LM2]
MRLSLGQLVYTSFSGMGFKALASPQIPPEIERAFEERIVSQYWNAYNPPGSGYRAAYLHQITPEHTLFGWVYNDGKDDIGRGDVPYFICYYLAAPLLDFELENIFTCLHKGPLTAIDRHNFAGSLDTIIVKNVTDYQPVRPGVVIPVAVRKHSSMNLLQAERIDIFVPLQELEIANNSGDLGLEYQINNPGSSQTHTVGEVEIIEGQTFTSSPSQLIEDIEPTAIEIIEGKTFTTSPAQLITERIRIQEVVTSKTIDKIVINSPGDRPVNSRIRSEVVVDPRSGVANLPAAKRTQRLLLIGIAATAIALAASIAAIVQQVKFTPDRPPASPTVSQPNFYKTFADVPNVPQGLFYYGGATTFAPVRFSNLASAINQAHPQFQLRYAENIGTNPGSGTAIGMLLSGEVSFVQSSRPLKDRELEQAKARGFELVEIPVAIDAIVFYVNPQVKIPGLSLSQVKDIFTGKITNWQQVGGPDLAIVPFTRDPETSGTVDVVKIKVLAGGEFSRNVRTVKTTSESLQKVAQTPGGIGFGSAAQVVNQRTVYPLGLSIDNSDSFVSPVVGYYPPLEPIEAALINGYYPLTRKLFIVLKKDGKSDELAGIAYANFLLSAQGQNQIDRAGFIPITSDK